MYFNEEILLQSFSRQLHMPIHLYDKEFQYQKTVCLIRDFKDPYYEYINIPYYLEICSQKQLPVCFSVEQTYYMITQNPNGYYVLGPFRMYESMELYLKETLPEYAPTISGKGYEQWFLQLPKLKFQEWLEHIYFLHNVFREKPVEENEILQNNLAQKDINIKLKSEFSKLLFHNAEESIRHNPYEQELREQASIEAGDLEALCTSMEEDYTGVVGTLAKDSVRNLKNIGIVLTTLASRSAIRGGLSPEVSFSLSDSYIQNMEEINNYSNLMSFIRSMEIHYCTLVNEIRTRKKRNTSEETAENPLYQSEKTNLIVKQCTDYIYTHLHEHITVKDLAKKLGYHPDYLSHTFKQHEKIGITEYIIRERIERSKNLLLYSEYTYSQIANYLCFASQSHFGKQFKRYTGYTPRQYRLFFTL